MFDDYCKEVGIVKHLTVRHTPQHNGVAKRMNQTLLQRVRCMRLNVGLSKEFWAKAVNTTVYLVNKSPSIVIDLKTAQEVWSGKPSNYFGLHIFGCPTYTHVNNGKLEPRAMKCIFLRYPTAVKGYIDYGVLKIIELKGLLLVEMLILMSLLCLAKNIRLKILQGIREFIKRWSLRLKIQRRYMVARSY